MKRFIRYLYEYEQGKKTRNVGFVKVEQDDVKSTIHIHGKGLRLNRGDSHRVSLFYEDDGRWFGVPQGEIAYMGPAINYRLSYTREDTGHPENYDEINGILIEGPDGRKFAAVWDDSSVDVNAIRPWSAGRRPDMDISPETEEMLSDEEEVPGEDMPMPEIEPDMDSDLDSDMVRETEPDLDSDMAVQEQGHPWKVTKIQRKEISMLPRCEWRLANNNFLLHGYYNYRHLILIDDGKMLKLGVPGIYHEKEARAAEGLGFPEFISAEETKLSLASEECNEEQRFGYWCRQVKRPPM